MSIISDFINRIRGVFNRQERLMPQVERENTSNYETQLTNSAERDTLYESSLNRDTMQRYESVLGYGEAEQRYFQNPGAFENQISLVDIVSKMENYGFMNEFMQRREYIVNNSSLYNMQDVHGVGHTSRVTLYVEMLSMLDNLPDHTRSLILTAAQLHDIGRVNDNIAYDHGIAGAERIEQLGLLNHLSPQDRMKVEFAVASHSMSREQVDFLFNERKMTPEAASARMGELVAKYGQTFVENYNRIQNFFPRNLSEQELYSYREVLTYLQDADKLDRARIANKSMQLDPTRLTHDTARRLIKVAHQNYFNFDKLIDYNYTKTNNPTKLQGYKMLRKSGVNLSLNDFENIMRELKPEALEYAIKSGDIRKLLSYDTYKAYGKPLVQNGVTQDTIIADQMFSEITERDQVSLLRKTFDEDYMLYHTLKRNNPYGYNLLVSTETDISMHSMSGALGQVTFADFQKFNDSLGVPIRPTDFTQLISYLRDDEYREVFDNGNYLDLFSSKYEKNANGVKYLKDRMAQKGISLPDEYIHANYRLLKDLVGTCPEYLKGNAYNDISLIEMYSAQSKLSNAKYRMIRGKTVSDDFEYDEETIGEFARFSKSYKHKATASSKTITVDGLDEERQMDVAREFARKEGYVYNPAYMEYVAKDDKPYVTNNPEEMINYTNYCATQILLDNDISLDEAKNKLLHTLFNIEVPRKFAGDFEKTTIKSLEKHRSYMPDSPLYSIKDDVVSNMIALFEMTDIDQFKKALYGSMDMFSSYHTTAIAEQVKMDLENYSKGNIASELQKSANNIRQLQQYQITATNGEVVNARVLNGQDFCMAISTHMPRCSSVSGKIFRKSGAKGILDNMYNRPLNPNDRCTTIIDQDMFAHSAAMLQDQELVYGYIPDGPQNISIMAPHDLSSVKRPNGRITNMAAKYMSCRDLTSSTTEEHNEAVMNGVYPDFIVCFDKIDEVAVNRQRQINDMYRRKGIPKQVEIVLVDAKQTYIPRNKMALQNRFGYINQKLAQGRFSSKDFQEFFGENGPENDIVLKTMQAIHNTSYRDDVYDPNYNSAVLGQVTDIIEKISEIIPVSEAVKLKEKSDMLIERGSMYGSGTRFYDHSYAAEIPKTRLENISNKLSKMANLIATRTGKKIFGDRPSTLTYNELVQQELPTFTTSKTQKTAELDIVEDEEITEEIPIVQNAGGLHVEELHVGQKPRKDRKIEDDSTR